VKQVKVVSAILIYAVLKLTGSIILVREESVNPKPLEVMRVTCISPSCDEISPRDATNGTVQFCPFLPPFNKLANLKLYTI
jgi:hypothetical protein